MTPESIPVTPQQPSREYYGPSDLALFQRFTRESYLKTFGVQAPDFDISRPYKDWFDSTANDPNQIASYKFIDPTETAAPSLHPFMMTQLEASQINLAGAVTYPPYVIRETNATAWGQPVNKIFLSLRSQADAIVAALGIGQVVDTGEGFVNYPDDEPRREWAITIAGRTMTVGFLLLAAYSRGVGSPGKWLLSGTGISWTPDPVGPANSDKPGRPMPVRDLLPNEEFHPFPFGLQIHRTDMGQPQTGTGGGLDAATKAEIDETNKLMKSLIKFFNIS